jgi:hypothetical protein
MHQSSAMSGGSDSVTKTLESLILDFRQAAPSLRYNNQLTAGTPSHPEPPTVSGLQFTFGPKELNRSLQRHDSAFVVHHGDVVSEPNIRTVKLLDEHLMPFLPKARGLFYLHRSVLADILAYRIRDWSQLGRGAGAIRLLGHGGRVNERFLRACIERNFAIDVSAPMELFPSYEELAEMADASDDCIVFGLRPAYVNPQRLVPALIDGVRTWAAGEGSGVPAMPIFLGWRTGEFDPHQEVAHYLKIVAGNLSADAHVTTRLGLLNEHKVIRSGRRPIRNSGWREDMIHGFPGTSGILVAP